MEAEAYGLLYEKYKNQEKEQVSILVAGSVAELTKISEYAKQIDNEIRYEKIVSYQKCEEIYEAITLFRSPTLLQKLLGNFPKDYPLHENGYTVFHYASEIGSFRMIEIIHEHGDDPNKGSASGITPLMLASSRGHIQCIYLLINYGGNLNLRDLSFG